MNKQDAINNIKEYLINEFEITESEAEENTSKNIIDLAVSYYDSQASYDIDKQLLILDCCNECKKIPVNYNNINNYLDYGLLAAMMDDIDGITEE